MSLGMHAALVNGNIRQHKHSCDVNIYQPTKQHRSLAGRTATPPRPAHPSATRGYTTTCSRNLLSSEVAPRTAGPVIPLKAQLSMLAAPDGGRHRSGRPGKHTATTRTCWLA